MTICPNESEVQGLREPFWKLRDSNANQESKELTSATRWSKAVSMFENDERFKAVERARDQEDLYESYIVELERKEKEKAAEERKQNIAEYRQFLESCDFIKENSQWRKVQDRLEDDERCLRLEKLDRTIFATLRRKKRSKRRYRRLKTCLRMKLLHLIPLVQHQKNCLRMLLKN
ncbi:unnamed protein product [Prunus armeniaca]|uniref:FF domain-containing protein n=1 Tax=Prunus armeniaca TaxID=36596 RepID=A0A6J5VBN9_PRUAR|nr:unnamed protein product [Prunus armeniaca]